MYRIIRHLVEKEQRLAIGLMSGTSLDAIDAALVSIAGSGNDTRVELMHFAILPFSPNERERLLRVCTPGVGTVNEVCSLNAYLGEKFAEAAQLVVTEAGYTMDQIDFISSHGQTVQHMPEAQATLQIGELAVIAARTGRVTVGDFRPADMSLGGQGAPLVPFVDSLLFSAPEESRALLNIGGIANVTVIPQASDSHLLMAFDTGPGNILIDGVVLHVTNGRQSFDRDGILACQGSVHRPLLEQWIAGDQFLHRAPPKSTGREYYTQTVVDKLVREAIGCDLGAPDLVATVTAYTYTSIALQFERFINPYMMYPVSAMWVGGGGAHNPVIMAGLREVLAIPVEPMESIAFSTDAKEAVAFAILGNEFLFGNANNLPTVTGARAPVSMGKLVLPPC